MSELEHLKLAFIAECRDQLSKLADVWPVLALLIFLMYIFSEPQNFHRKNKQTNK